MVESKAQEKDLLRILEAILVETIRYNYAGRKLAYEETAMAGSVKIMCRPPEPMDLESMIKKNEDGGFSVICDKIVYPDPPVYSEEIEFFETNGIHAYTPIEAPLDGSFLSGEKIGISISEPDVSELAQYGLNVSHTEKLSLLIANYILGRKGTLVYGGDLRNNGYTEQLIMEAAALRDRLNSEEIHLKNFISWPIYIKDSDALQEWKARNKRILQMIEVGIDEKAASYVESERVYASYDTIAHRYAWSRSLTKMRREMIADCTARICAGGRLTGYKGKLPGVLEEILIHENEED